MPRLKRKFFDRPTVAVARDLLGKYLVRKIGNRKITARIIETEAYCGPNDKASHASKGKTSRTELMFGAPGYIYVYFIYGMYHCLNIVTEKEGYPAAVLIRGLEVVGGLPRSELSNGSIAAKLQSKVLLRGPGKLCRELKIDRKLNGQDLVKNKTLWIEDRGEKAVTIKKGKRIGIDYAGEWRDKLWRFYL